MTDTIDLRAHTTAERERLADLLATLTPDQWAAPSLCTGWRVREVVAHMTMAYRISLPRFAIGLAAARFSFNRYADRAARADTRRLSDAELLTCLRDNVNHPWQPPGGGPAGALSHDVIHGLDITEPLGLPAAPADRIALVLGDGDPKTLAYFGVDLTGVQLRATDADCTIGSGTPVAMPAKDILLTVTGRRPVERG
ncbi:maleylpyruvate isomerase family mycothiol-dependent enzyme [Nocardia otitidiscaviarum]|uniref:Maleylpyruvate isomerase family mycothiol-dependent enzyme n=1 Tax=Nocardia otitidiscaviarum TaxID=1823 RepID=A0A516NM48_9NOCA|nr:maleylpyruvate isomerase family mycothiol-dependent enzyme [Nocardia otitidiscaviarum]MCP9624867.1 maleylpyruvate isomerase family mycothiol-dependent enzyme [Nocardia otitidiscaviarum]QDP79990.1 maleylpyruvate isomerase family mycothiol-dependent enzyme [Nocardia otitidiscaviarum]